MPPNGSATRPRGLYVPAPIGQEVPPAADGGITVAGWQGLAGQARSRKNYAVGLEISCPGGAYNWAP
jgi:hypothetical protein